MSRTRKMYSTIMENKLVCDSTSFGFNAIDGGNDIEFLFNKLLGNEKHYIEDPNLKLTEKSFTSDDTTYTLDDLFDLSVNVDHANISLEDALSIDDPQAHFANFVQLDTVLGSPISSSGEESCDLNELLFQDKKDSCLSFLDQCMTEKEINGSLDASFMKNDDFVSSNDVNGSKTSMDGDSNQTNTISTIVGNDQSVPDKCTTENDFNNLLTLLYHNNFDLDLVEEPQNMCNNSSFTPLSSSDSDSDDIRFSPYKKSKKQKTAEQKQRKKLQNRNAASRYRSKKKDQLKTMSAEADELEEKNKELKGKVDGLRSEIDYLKNLMLDVIKARLAKGTVPIDLLSNVLS